MQAALSTSVQVIQPLEGRPLLLRLGCLPRGGTRKPRRHALTCPQLPTLRRPPGRAPHPSAHCTRERSEPARMLPGCQPLASPPGSLRAALVGEGNVGQAETSCQTNICG